MIVSRSVTLPETENRPSQQERIVFQPYIFRGFCCQFQGGYMFQLEEFNQLVQIVMMKVVE